LKNTTAQVNLHIYVYLFVHSLREFERGLPGKGF